MTNKEESLTKSVKEFYSEGNLALIRDSYNSAASLFFKALAVLADWIILRDKGFIPKSHTDRFRILEQDYLEIYELLDQDFPVYKNSYTI